jgi:hypothetical protein
MQRLKKRPIFLLVLNLNWGCSECVQLLYLRPEITLTLSAIFWLAVWFCAFSSIIALFASWKLLELVYFGPEHRLRRMVCSTSVQVVRYRSPHWYKGSVNHNHGGFYILSSTVLWSAARTIQAWFSRIYNRPF